MLLVRQSYRDGWAAPGGLLRRGEEPDIGAAREAKEEVEVEREGEAKPRFGAEKETEADRMKTGRYEPKERGKR